MPKKHFSYEIFVIQNISRGSPLSPFRLHNFFVEFKELFTRYTLRKCVILIRGIFYKIILFRARCFGCEYFDFAFKKFRKFYRRIPRTVSWKQRSKVKFKLKTQKYDLFLRIPFLVMGCSRLHPQTDTSPAITCDVKYKCPFHLIFTPKIVTNLYYWGHPAPPPLNATFLRTLFNIQGFPLSMYTQTR